MALSEAKSEAADKDAEILRLKKQFAFTVGKWFSNFDESACIAVTFTMATAVVVPVALAVAYAQSGLRITTDALPAIALLAVGTILATGFGRVLYQKSLTLHRGFRQDGGHERKGQRHPDRALALALANCERLDGLGWVE